MVDRGRGRRRRDHRRGRGRGGGGLEIMQWCTSAQQTAENAKTGAKQYC